MILVSMRFRAWETIVLGLLADMLWLPGGVHLPLYLIFSIALVWAFEPLRKELLFWTTRLGDDLGVLPDPYSRMMYDAIGNMGGVNATVSG